MWSAILGILVFGAMLALLVVAMRQVNSRMDDPARRPVQRDPVDRARDSNTTGGPST